MNRLYLLTVVTLLVCGFAVAQQNVVGDIHSDNNDLSWMISVSGPWDGTNPDLGQTDKLPYNVEASVDFKNGTFHKGTYRGWLHGPEGVKKGDDVFYEVESRDFGGEWRRIVKAGRCGNPATGRYYHANPVTPPAVCTTTPPKTIFVGRVVVTTHTEYVETPGEVKTVFINTGYYHPPAGLTQESGTNISVPNGRAFYGSEENQVVLGFHRAPDQPKPSVCPPGPPPPPPPPGPPPPGGPTCPPGTAPPPPPPSSPGVNVTPHDPSTPVVPGGDSVPPGVGLPPPAPPDHGVITPGPGEPPTPPHMPEPDGPHQADPVDPTTL